MAFVETDGNSGTLWRAYKVSTATAHKFPAGLADETGEQKEDTQHCAKCKPDQK